MKASDLTQALVAMTAARDLLWKNTPGGTPGKQEIDIDLFRAISNIESALSRLDVQINPER